MWSTLPMRGSRGSQRTTAARLAVVLAATTVVTVSACTPDDAAPPTSTGEAPTQAPSPRPDDASTSSGTGPTGSADTGATTSTAALPADDVAYAEVAWTRKLTPASAVRVVDGIPILYVVKDKQLVITALDPETGKTLWRAPATTSFSTPGVGLDVSAVDGVVVHLELPTGEETPGQAVITRRDPASGMRLSKSPIPVYVTTLPDACADDAEAVCVDVATGPTSVESMRLKPTGQLVPDTSSVKGWSGIGPLGLSRKDGHRIGRLDDGDLLWRADLHDVVSPSSTTDYGWIFRAAEDGSVVAGSVGDSRSVTAGGRVIDEAESVAFGLDAETGEVLWKQQGVDLFCDIEMVSAGDDQGGDADLDDPLIACLWRSGTVTARQDDVSIRDADLDLVRLDPRTGDALWTVALQGGDDTLFDGGSPAIAQHSQSQLTVGTGPSAQVVDVETGAVGPIAATDVVWVEKATSTALDPPSAPDIGTDGRYAATGVLRPLTVEGDAARKVTWPLPPQVGAETDTGLRVVAQPRAVVAYREP